MFKSLVNTDNNLFLLINGAHNQTFDFIMWWISKPITWLPLYILMAYIIIRKYKQSGIIFIILAGLLIALSDQTSVHLFKNVFQRLRPCHNPELQGLVHMVNGKCGGSYGFVSSHAANMFAVATYVFLILRKHYRYFSLGLFFWAALVSYSRIYLGVHYPADVFAGALLGVVCGIITWYIAGFVQRRYFKQHT